MNELDRKLYELLGDKTLSFGCYVSYDGAWQKFGRIDEKFLNECCDDSVTECWEGEYNTSQIYEIIGHEPTISDLHRWMNDNTAKWTQEEVGFSYHFLGGESKAFLYDSSKSLISQSDETKLAIISLITSHS